MPRNGSGGYSPPPGQPVVSGTAISSTVFNALVADLGNELTKSICTDGQTPMTANLPMGANRVTNLGAAVAGSDAARLDQIAPAVASAVAGYLPLAGGTMSGAIAMGTARITNLGAAVSASDAVRLDQITGYLPLSGGTVSGTVTLNNSVAITGKDTVGTGRLLLSIDGTNNVNIGNAGGQSIRFLNSAGGVIAFINEAGNLSLVGNVTLANTKSLSLTDSVGTVRPFATLNAANNVLIGNAGGQNIKFTNSAGGEIANLTEGGTFSAIVVTQTSDERKKKLWQRMPKGFVSQLAKLRKSGLFTWRKGGAIGIGVGGQSFERIFPAAVHTDEKGNKSVNYGAAALVSCVELAVELEALKAEITKLAAK